MRTFFNTLLALLCLFIFCGCKKSTEPTNNTPTPSPITVTISGLTDNTAVSIKMLLKSDNSVLLFVPSPKKGNQTYTTNPVSSGSAILVNYASTVPCSDNGDGKGTITFTYNGKSIDPTTGCLQSNGFTLSAF